MCQSLAHMQMYDYLLKKYSNKELFPKTKMVIEMDGKLWAGDFIRLEDCHIIETDWDDQRYTPVEKTRAAINQEFDEKIQNSNVNVSENRIDSKISKLKDIEILYAEIKAFVDSVDSKKTTLRPFLYNVFCLDTRTQLPFLDITGKEIHFVSLTQ
ncbi:hypothetical protein X560_0339 [Listeria fleischmannii 1991]|uniref:Uncharacterized protein n=2 Tax=Listeria fleischmannii TaxID=1069827 RepID=A0A2X3JC39_9LIST|nr:hypothetical protein [Listeria fleischmannii]EMG27327.1 hypothetical protein LFLEISCH_11550 [Listeria fleischmannii subsp. fleischmannii LU2006-1]KMT60919.1 hypothetical protein X560_0339 [Listeria fleischmannii 1991]MBC1418456.1 hypothetical protein [Listeria fleischmannii]SQC70639.1 Uncharacterised protein [Listeria fleischmannii subsp. fleischmannii]